MKRQKCLLWGSNRFSSPLFLFVVVVVVSDSLQQNETPRGRDPRRDPALKAAKRAANSRKDSDAQNSEGSFSDGLRRKQRPQGMLGMSQSMSTSKRRSAAIQVKSISLKVYEDFFFCWSSFTNIFISTFLV